MPYNVISLDFSFSGIVSKDKSRRKDVLGINGEVGWILADDQFSKILHVDTRKNKAAPTKWLDDFLGRYAPPGCTDRYVLLDQGGELYGSHAIQKILAKHKYKILPTGAGASHQNSCERYPVSYTHLTLPTKA